MNACAERYGYAALTLLTLSPVALQGLWRALAVALNADVDAARVTCGALAIAAIVLLARRAIADRHRALPGVLAAVVAGGLGLALGPDRASAAVVAASRLGVALFNAALLPWLLGRLPAELDGLAARHKAVATLMIVLGLLAVTATSRLSVFMGDAARADLSMIPDVPVLVHHSCLTAYVEGADLAAQGVHDLYDTTRRPDLNGTPITGTNEGRHAPFRLDAFA